MKMDGAIKHLGGEIGRLVLYVSSDAEGCLAIQNSALRSIGGFILILLKIDGGDGVFARESMY